jgi:3',5'-cyclic AMP phosphodiesterase CpdA
MVTSIDRPQLRALLIDTLRTDGDFNAFVLDYFPDVQRNFAGGMDRTSKLNLLLESVDGDDILRGLIKLKPALAARLHMAAVSAPAAPSVTSTPVEKPSPASIDPVSPPVSLASKPPPKYVLHLSDLHFSDETQADQWHAQLLLDLRNQMKIQELSAVVISGDITNHATVEQFGFAQSFLQQLCESFHTAKQRLIIVPGNHDVNWTLTDQGQDGFSPFATFYQQLTGSAYPPSAAAQTTLLHLADLKLLVLGLNSAWKIDRAHPSRAGLHAGAFGKALGSLLKNEEYQTCNKLAVWHHPPAELTAEAGLDGAVLEQLAQAGFRLILHGHIHRADNALFRYYRQSSVGGLEILTAGTFGAPTHELVSGYPFQYQVLEFRGDILTVHTRKRENVAGGWVGDHRWQQAPGHSPLSSYQIALRTTQSVPQVVQVDDYVSKENLTWWKKYWTSVPRLASMAGIVTLGILAMNSLLDSRLRSEGAEDNTRTHMSEADRASADASNTSPSPSTSIKSASSQTLRAPDLAVASVNLPSTRTQPSTVPDLVTPSPKKPAKTQHPTKRPSDTKTLEFRVIDFDSSEARDCNGKKFSLIMKDMAPISGVVTNGNLRFNVPHDKLGSQSSKLPDGTALETAGGATLNSDGSISAKCRTPANP